MKTSRKLLMTVLLMAMSGFLVITGCQNNSVSSNANTAGGASSDPTDVVPGLYNNQIHNTATAPGFQITKMVVENNTDMNGKTVNDHLELVLKNTAGKDLTGFEVYYTITDNATGAKEGYYKALPGFVLKSGETTSIHFDNGHDSGHFSVNLNSLYYKSVNKLQLEATVSATGYKTEIAQVQKSAGGAEARD
ncbi:MAG: hypothetical protein ACYCXF_02470 [Thermoleophilia bacterium]